MGEPVKIVISPGILSCFRAFSPTGLRIQLTGLRPGEKLFEELNLQMSA